MCINFLLAIREKIMKWLVKFQYQNLAACPFANPSAWLQYFILYIFFKFLQLALLLRFGYLLGTWAKKILVVVNKVYPSELHSAVRKFLEVFLGALIFHFVLKFIYLFSSLRYLIVLICLTGR